MRPPDLPDASHWPHGTRSRYVAGRCRCVPCRAADSRWKSERYYAVKRGEWNGLVSASPARAHLLLLSEQGVGRRAVSAASGISQSIIHKIRTGQRQQIRAQTERRILHVDRSCASDHTLVSAAKAWVLLNRLKADGYPAAQLARFMGYRGQALQFNRHRMTVRNVHRVERLYAWVKGEAAR